MPSRFILSVVLAVSLGWGTASAQKHHDAHQPDTVEVENVQELVTKGSVHGHVRNYFMATRNFHNLNFITQLSF